VKEVCPGNGVRLVLKACPVSQGSPVPRANRVCKANAAYRVKEALKGYKDSLDSLGLLASRVSAVKRGCPVSREETD
jgi:hypothetical protein